MSAKVLVVDDEPQIRRLFRAALTRGGYQVAEAADGRSALSLLSIEKPDLVLLDLGLPDRDGLELVERLAAAAAVLVVSARDAVDEKVAALDLGASDFVTKPFDPDELLARIRSVLRQRLAAQAERRVVTVADVEIDLLARAVHRDGAALHLPPKEYGVLAELARHPGRVLTHAHLLRAVWGPAHEADIAYLRVAVRGLRARLGPMAAASIVNEPGVGYRLMS
jgi:two-component system KDP operon response regulator KdpE